MSASQASIKYDIHLDYVSNSMQASHFSFHKIWHSIKSRHTHTRNVGQKRKCKRISIIRRSSISFGWVIYRLKENDLNPHFPIKNVCTIRTAKRAFASPSATIFNHRNNHIRKNGELECECVCIFSPLRSVYNLK